MSLQKDIQKLLQAEIIDRSTADRIESYYNDQQKNSSSALLLIFGVLGALLAGLGIILILAHNWDQLPRAVKTVFAFIPLVAGQILCAYTLSRRPHSRTWRESSAVFLTLSIGASIALVSQIYHLEGELAGFLLIWIILALPIIYVMHSGMTALLAVIATAVYGMQFVAEGLFTLFCVCMALLGAVIPFYLRMVKNDFGSNLLSFLHFLIPIAMLCGFGILISGDGKYIMMMFMNLFGIAYMLGNAAGMRSIDLKKNGYVIIGALGMIVLLLVHSFDSIWIEVLRDSEFNKPNNQLGLWAFASTFLVAAGGLVYHFIHKSLDKVTPMMPVFLLFAGCYMLVQVSLPGTVLAINLILLLIAVLTIMAGVSRDHLGILNYGLLVITALLICRFFDTSISFVVRGLLFIVVGVSFFFANRLIINKRKAHDQ